MSELYPSPSVSEDVSEDEEDDLKKPLVLVTGGSGMIGHAIRAIATSDHSDLEFRFLSSPDCDLAGDYRQVRELFSRLSPTYVVHLAARVGGLYRNSREKLQMYDINMAINRNVIMACRETGVQKAVCCLSTCVFPDEPSTGFPFDESILHDGPPHPSNEGYAYAKRMMEIQARLHNEDETNTCQFLCVTPTNVYGPYDNFDLEDSHVIPGLIHRCYLAKRAGKPFVVRGTGKPLRQFIFSGDLARLMMRVLMELKPDDIPRGIILTPDAQDEVSIGELAQCIASATNVSEIRYDPQYSDGQYRKTASNGLLRRFFPDMKFTRLGDGIKRTVDWFHAHKDTWHRC